MSNSAPPTINVESVSKRFSRKRGDQSDDLIALQEVSFCLNEGDFVCLLGPTGCGKTTLLNIIAGFDKPSSGRVLMNGQAVDGPSPDRGVIFQEDTLFPWMTVRDNVLFGPRCRRDRADDEKAGEYLDLVRLSGFENYYPGELSGGMKQRAALARVLILSPQVLLLDEPFGALDAQSREEAQDLLLSVCAKLRQTVLFITHDIAEAAYLGDRVLVMTPRPGRIYAEIVIDLPRPRQPDLRESSELTERKKMLREALKAASRELDRPQPPLREMHNVAYS